MKIEELNQKIASLAVGESLRLENVPDEVYHASEGFGSSKIKSFMKCPQLFKSELDGLHKATQAMAIGSAFHCAVLEPERFEIAYAKAPEINKRTKAGRAEWEVLQSSSVEHLSPKDFDQVVAMRDSCKAKFSHFLEDGSPEVSYWMRHDSGLIVKARIDWECGDLAVDLKSTADVFKFESAARSFQYDIQAAHYLQVCSKNLTEMVFLPTGSTEPYLSGTPLLISEQRLYDRTQRWHIACHELAESLETGIYKGMPDQPEILELKPWEK
jgi:hypothetical protein